MNYTEKAQTIYERTRPDPRYVQMMGESSLTSVQKATLDEIENHLRLVDEVAQEYKVRLEADKIPFGVTREEIEHIANGKTARRRRSAGARALSNKYGKDAAERIIYRKTGKHVNLRS